MSFSNCSKPSTGTEITESISLALLRLPLQHSLFLFPAASLSLCTWRIGGLTRDCLYRLWKQEHALALRDDSSVMSRPINTHLHTHTRSEPNSLWGEAAVSLQRCGPVGEAPELDVNLLTLGWWSRSSPVVLPPPSMFYAVRGGGRQNICVCRGGELFSPAMHISSACSSQWSGPIGLDHSLVWCLSVCERADVSRLTVNTRSQHFVLMPARFTVSFWGERGALLLFFPSWYKAQPDPGWGHVTLRWVYKPWQLRAASSQLFSCRVTLGCINI